MIRRDACFSILNLQEDPKELSDLGDNPTYSDVCSRLHETLFEWSRKPRKRSTVADGTIESINVQDKITETGILIGFWDEAELEHALRPEFGPRMSNANPLVAPTLNKLLRRTPNEDKK